MGFTTETKIPSHIPSTRLISSSLVLEKFYTQFRTRISNNNDHHVSSIEIYIYIYIVSKTAHKHLSLSDYIHFPPLQKNKLKISHERNVHLVNLQSQTFYIQNRNSAIPSKKKKPRTYINLTLFDPISNRNPLKVRSNTFEGGREKKEEEFTLVVEQGNSANLFPRGAPIRPFPFSVLPTPLSLVSSSPFLHPPRQVKYSNSY